MEIKNEKGGGEARESKHNGKGASGVWKKGGWLIIDGRKEVLSGVLGKEKTADGGLNRKKCAAIVKNHTFEETPW